MRGFAGKARMGVVLSILLMSGARPAWSQEEGREFPVARRAGIWGVTLGTVWNLAPRDGGPIEVIVNLLPEMRPRMHYYLSPYMSLEGEIHLGGDWQQNAFSLANGAGLLEGSEIGMGARLFPFRTRWTPALGGGAYLYAGGREFRVQASDWTLSMQAGPTVFGWLYGGADFVGPRGFTFSCLLGYKHLLTPQSIRIDTTGQPDRSPESFRNAVYALGYHLSMSFGKSFGL